MSNHVHDEAPPPSYEQAMATPGPRDSRPGTSNPSSSSRPGTSGGPGQAQFHADNLLHVPGDDHHGHDGIPTPTRLSMEDELRPLPEGWVRTYDPETNHQFFVDTKADPFRSIWHHPYDDEHYLNSLSPAERDRIEQLKHRTGHTSTGPSSPTPSHPSSSRPSRDHSPHPPPRSPRQSTQQHHDQEDEHTTLGRKLKDKLTGTTHSERVSARAARSQAEREALRQHLLLRRAMASAMSTSRPQLLGKDDNGVDLYLEPPGHMFPGVASVKPLTPYLSEVFYERDGTNGGVRQPGPPGRYLRPEGSMYGFGYGGYDCGVMGGGRYARPVGPSARPGWPGGSYYGGGLGVPLMAPMLGGVMLGSLMF